MLAHLATQPRKNRGKDLTALFRRERLIFRPAKRRFVAAVRGIFLFDERRCLLNQIECGEVTVLVIIGPVDEAVLAHHDAVQLRVLARDVLHGEAKFESRPHPWHVTYFLAVNLFRQRLAARRRGDGDDGIGMGVVHVPGREE